MKRGFIVRMPRKLTLENHWDLRQIYRLPFSLLLTLIAHVLPFLSLLLSPHLFGSPLTPS